jgi:cytochrome b561
MQIRLHWIVFVLVVGQFVFHDPIKDAWRAVRRGTEGVPIDLMVRAHVFGGIAILALVVWRLVLRAGRGAPPAPVGMSPRLLRLSALTHWGLYAALIAMSLSGGMAWFGQIDIAADVHEVVRAILLGLIALHVGAAVWHQVWRRDNLLARMR